METGFDFSFGFECPIFSDKILKIELLPQNSYKTYKRRRLTDSKIGTDGSDSGSGKRKTTYIDLPINALLLAGASLYFKSLFINGMKESSEKKISIKIQESERYAFLDLIKFLYHKTLSSYDPPFVISILILADRYGVANCVNHCCSKLSNMEMSWQNAVECLNIAKELVNGNADMMVISSRNKIVTYFEDVSRVEEDLLALPLCGFMLVMASDEVIVESEDVLFGIMLKWSKTKYTDPVVRSKVMTDNLLPLIRYQFLSSNFMEVISSDLDLDIVLENQVLHHLRSNCDHVDQDQRNYLLKPFRTIELNCHHEIVVYYDLKLSNVRALYPSGRILSQFFTFKGHKFQMTVQCNEAANNHHTMGFSLLMIQNGAIHLSYEFSIRMFLTGTFSAVSTGNWVITGQEVEGDPNLTISLTDLVGSPWASVTGAHSLCNYNGYISIKVQLKKR